MSPVVRFTGARGGSGTTVIAITTAISHKAVQLVGNPDDLRTFSGLGSDQLTDRLHLAAAYEPVEGLTVVDGGSIAHPYQPDGPHPLPEPDLDLVVIRGPSYEGVLAVTTSTRTFHGVVVISERGRALRHTDVQAALGNIPIIADIDHDPAIARAVDAGLLITRPPQQLTAAVTERIKPWQNQCSPSNER